MSNDIQTTSATRDPSASAGAGADAKRRARQGESTLTPPVDVIEDAQGITLYADLPGVSRDRLDLQVEADTLIIEAESDMTLPEGLTSQHTEIGLARWRRVFTLSKELDAEKVSAELAQGVLKLTIPKAGHAQPRRIQVNVA